MLSAAQKTLQAEVDFVFAFASEGLLQWSRRTVSLAAVLLPPRQAGESTTTPCGRSHVHRLTSAADWYKHGLQKWYQCMFIYFKSLLMALEPGTLQQPEEKLLDSQHRRHWLVQAALSSGFRDAIWGPVFAVVKMANVMTIIKRRSLWKFLLAS